MDWSSIIELSALLNESIDGGSFHIFDKQTISSGSIDHICVFNILISPSRWRSCWLSSQLNSTVLNEKRVNEKANMQQIYQMIESDQWLWTQTTVTLNNISMLTDCLRRSTTDTMQLTDGAYPGHQLAFFKMRWSTFETIRAICTKFAAHRWNHKTDPPLPDIHGMSGRGRSDFWFNLAGWGYGCEGEACHEMGSWLEWWRLGEGLDGYHGCAARKSQQWFKSTDCWGV